jgi:hypothetical protein
VSTDSPSAAPRGSPSLAARVWRAIAMVLVFVAAGSPIGGLAFMLLVAATYGSWGRVDPVFELIHSPLDLLLESMFFGYWFGAGPTAVAGLAIGIKQAFFGPTTWWMALGMGFVAGVVLVEELGGGFESDSDHVAHHAVLILTCVVAIMLCWRMVRNWYFAPIGTRAAP